MLTQQSITHSAQKLGKLPGVAAIFLSGSLAQGHGGQNSDIDFFVIAHPGQIWTARFFVFVYLKLKKQLAKPHDHAGKICPNHFITTNQLEIQEKDAYSANLFSHNQPAYDPGNIFVEFVQQNQWVRDFGEKFVYPVGTGRDLSRAGRDRPLRKPIEFVLKHLQTRIIKNNPEFKTPGAKIILTSTELRFHPNPRNKNWSKRKG